MLDINIGADTILSLKNGGKTLSWFLKKDGRGKDIFKFLKRGGDYFGI